MAFWRTCELLTCCFVVRQPGCSGFPRRVLYRSRDDPEVLALFEDAGSNDDGAADSLLDRG